MEVENIKATNSNKQYCRYYLYIEEGEDITPINDIKDINKEYFKNTNTACFSGLTTYLRDDIKANRLIYLPKCIERKESPNKSDIPKWIKLCQKNGFLPKDMWYDMDKEYYVIKLYKELSPDTLYIYLTSLRMFQEDVGFPKTMLKLVNKYNLNFYVAWVVSSRLCVGNGGHNIISISRGLTKDLKTMRPVPIIYAYNLYQLIKNDFYREKYNIYKGDRWKISWKINSIQPVSEDLIKSSSTLSISPDKIFDKWIDKFMNSPKEEALKILKKQIKKD